MSAARHARRTRLPQTSPAPVREGQGQGAAHPSHLAVRIDIGTLRLHGYSAAQGQRFLRSLEVQLAQHAIARSAWTAIASRHLAHLAPLSLRAGTSPEKAACMIAQQLFDLCCRPDPESRHG